VTVVVADSYPNFSICGIPYSVPGEVTDWRQLAHLSQSDLTNTGMKLRLNTRATEIDADGHRVRVGGRDGAEQWLDYDALLIGTGAVPVRPPIRGLDQLDASDGVHLLHTIADMLDLE
jgi:NADPH-dependent 2,4-dienoyl-CoA reductase/sulfur reductase-like enzyme